MRVEEAEPPGVRLTDVGLRDTCGPAGVTEALKFTVPEKPFVLVSVMEVVPDEPGATVRDVGLDVIEKSAFVTVTLTVVLCTGDPELFVPVIVTLYGPEGIV